MAELIIETAIDKLLKLLREKKKVPISEALRILKVTEPQLESWIGSLEDHGIVELKYPVLGEPEIVLKGEIPEELPEELKAKPEMEEKFEEEPIETVEEKSKKMIEKISEVNEDEIKAISKKLGDLEGKVSKMSYEIDSSNFKEELFEILVVIAGMKDVKRISSYLKVVERIIKDMKSKKLWNRVDEELTITVLEEVGENWREKGNINIAKIFEEISKRIRIS
jgi:DNA-binding transcriptional ArsR family regulator